MILSTSALAQEMPEDENAVSIIDYFMIGEDEYPQANVSLEQFENQVVTLKDQSNITSLPEIISKWEQDTKLPSKTIAITFDGGHRSILTKALPILIKYKIPFTIFIASNLADTKSPQYLNWHDIKKLQKTGLATIGMHPSSYAHYTGIEQFTKDLNKARARFREELNEVPTLFSFPFGEYDAAALNLIKQQGFTAFGQESGIAYKNLQTIGVTIPRFTMNEFHSSEERLNMIINSLPLPVTDITRNPIGFTALNGNKNISCYSNNQNGIDTEKINENRVEIRPNEPISTKRLRINCTQKTNDNQIRWLGFLITG